MSNRITWKTAIGYMTTVVAGFAVAAAIQVPFMAANQLLHPARTTRNLALPAGCHQKAFPGEEVTLRGWDCPAVEPRRGTLVFLDGVANNRGSAAGLTRRFSSAGLDVIAYDSRGQGESEGDACTYGFFEKRDLRRVMDGLRPGPVVLFGTSLGAAVALQAAVDHPRVTGIIAAEVFSDLSTIGTERASTYLPGWTIWLAFRLAEVRGGFDIEKVSPAESARSVRIPVLLIHGADDRDTWPDHSKRVLAALAGPKRLILVRGAGHNESLRDPQIWSAIDGWIQDLLQPAPG